MRIKTEKRLANKTERIREVEKEEGWRETARKELVGSVVIKDVAEGSQGTSWEMGVRVIPR